MAKLEELLRKKADQLLNLPVEAQRFITNPESREAGLGVNQYQAELPNMYNTAKDPDQLNALSRLYNNYQGIVDKDASTNALERIANEAGYEGIYNPTGAISFYPQDIKRIK